jgi:hypothetical protein
MSLFLFTGCGDLEPEMQDTRTVILNMDFHGKSSSRSSSSVSTSELSQYNTHLILALPSGEVLTSNYMNFDNSFAQGLMNTAAKIVSLEIPLNTQMKIFAFLFKETYSLSDLKSGLPSLAGYYGKSQTFSIGTQTNNLSLGITLIQVPGTGTDPGGGTDTLLDTTAPTASVTTATITTSGSAVVQSTEIGTAYLVNTAITVSNLDSITGGAADNKWNSVAIISPNTNTYLTATGLVDGTYKVYAVDAAGNISSASSNSVTVAVVTDYALNFDGTNDYVSIPNNPFSNNNTFTIQAWLKPEVVGDGAYHGFLGMQLSGRKPSLWVNTNGDLHYDSYKGSQRFSGTISDGSNKFFTVSEWVHVGWTNDGSNYKFYKNGNLVATETAPDTFNALDNIGYQIGKVDNYFNGQIDEVAIWDVALGSANITAIYNSRIGLKASVDSGNYDKSDDLVGYWQFNEGIGSTLTDNTSNSNNGTLNNMDSSPWVTSGLNLTN